MTGGIWFFEQFAGEKSHTMQYTSTRKNVAVSSAQAITQGISKEGGLFVPKEIPLLSQDEIAGLTDKSYIDRAAFVLNKYLTDFTAEDVLECVSGAYSNLKFEDDIPAPISKLSDSMHILELWHGPTCAFKDMALQLLPYLLTKSAAILKKDNTIVILVATSGDTGKAALEGFRNVKNTKILVFFRSDGVSLMQKLQMVTQEGDNVAVCAIEGNFDDAQTGVKRIFTNEEIQNTLSSHNMEFSSANSINWGRLVPQIVYYISAYCDLVKEGSIKQGDPINAVVPTGNFGNILAAYYAKKMGIPIQKLICASNKNNILTDFIKTGVYDRNRDFFCTTSPSMDILISSNLERLLYHLTDDNADTTADWMNALEKTGKYEIDGDTKQKISDSFFAAYCDDETTAATIKSIFSDYSYLCDTHTAVAIHAYEAYRKETGDETVSLIVSTASPYKFAGSVLAAVDETLANGTEIEMAEKLEELTGVKIPLPLKNLDQKQIRFKEVCQKENMKDIVFDLLIK